jgi:hypothetical protein
VRRIGVLINSAADDPLSPAYVAALAQGLEKSGWSMGRDMQVEYRWNADPIHARRNASELIALAPAVILANGSPATAAVQAATSTIPVVFIGVIDPVGAGFVEGLARPGSNIIGFLLYEYGLGSKWLELLRDMVPSIQARWDYSGHRHRSGNRATCCDPGGGTAAGRGVAYDRRARCRRDRAWHRRFCSRIEWRSYRAGKWLDVQPSRDLTLAH